jgi:DNA sulfur modification protein DndD
MILKRIEIDNFRSYRQKTTFDFAPPDPSKERNIYLIGGRNATGKTSFLGALYLCLFGRFQSRDNTIRVQHPSDMIEQVHGAYEFRGDRQAISRMIMQRGNQQIRLAVIYDDKGTEFTIERVWEPRQPRQPQTGRILDYHEHLSMYENGAKLYDWTPEEIVQWIEMTIPRGTAEYFFFDGEKVDHFADPDRVTHDLKLALERLLGIHTYRELQEHLDEYVVTKIRSESTSRVESEILTTKGQIKSLESDLQEIETAIEQVGRDLADSRRAGEKIAQELSDLWRGGAGAEAQRRQIGKLERKKDLEYQFDRLAEEKRCLLEEILPYSLLYTEMTGMIVESDRLEQESISDLAHKYVERVGERLASRSVETQSCPLCGAPSSGLTASQARVTLQGCLNEEPSRDRDYSRGRLRSPLSKEMQRSIENILQSVRMNTRTFGDYVQEERRLKNEIERLNGEIADLEPAPEAEQRYQRLQAESRNNAAEIERLTAKEMQLVQEKEKKQREMRALCSRLDELEEEEEKLSKEQRILSLARASQKVLQEYVDRLRKERLADLEERTTNIFQMLLASSVYHETAGKITFERDTYRPEVWLEGAPKDPRAISRGIQQLYALSLLGGLCKSATTSMPLVIDSPLSGLDEENRACVLDSFFPKAADQVILLARDDEIGPVNLKPIDDHVVQKCILIFDPDRHATTVETNAYF